MKLLTALLRLVPIDERGRRALDEVVADWQHESGVAASGAGRVAVFVRAAGALSKTLVLVIAAAVVDQPRHSKGNTMTHDTNGAESRPTRSARKRVILATATLGLLAVAVAVWSQLPGRYDAEPPDPFARMTVSEITRYYRALGNSFNRQLQGRDVDVTGVVWRTGVRYGAWRGSPYVSLSSSTKTPQVQRMGAPTGYAPDERLFPLDPSVDLGALAVGQTVTLRCRFGEHNLPISSGVCRPIG